MTRRYAITVCLGWGGDTPTGEAEVTCTYAVEWDESPYGPPMHEPVDIEIGWVDGRRWSEKTDVWCSFGLNYADALDELVNKIEMDRAEDLVEHAQEIEAGLADEEAEAQAEMYAQLWHADDYERDARRMGDD